MSSSLGPVDLDCDAPPDPVVEACAALGFRTPLDVRWLRQRRLLHEQEPSRGALSVRHWLELLGVSRSRVGRCTCGQRLPRLRRYHFAFPLYGEGHYRLAQCCRCHTMFWDRG